MLPNYKNNRCYIIAEIGGNFTTFKQAQILIDEAASCGVDAIKIQTYQAESVASKKALFYMENTGIASQFDLFKKYEIDEDLHRKVFEYINSKKVDWFSTPSHENDVILLDALGVPAYKVGSDDAVNIPFLKFLAKRGKPIILSTGMCTMEEIRQSVSAILGQGNEQLMLLHAVTSYPTHPQDVNLEAMVAMIKEFPNLDIGYSDHTIGTNACICAAAMGARIIEKHFTYDKNESGPDHMLSAESSEMKEIVDRIREFEIMRGSGIKRPANSEKTTRINNRKSIVIAQSIKKGEKLTRCHLAIKRPGYGIEPRYLDEVIGRIVNRDLELDEVLMREDL